MPKQRPPKPVGPRIKDEKAYERAIKERILNPLFSGTMRRMHGIPGYKQAYIREINEEFERILRFEQYGQEVVQPAMDNIRAVHKAKMVKSFQAALGVDIMPLMSDLAIRPLMNQALMENVALIKSIPEKLNLQIVEEIGKIFDEKGFDEKAIFDMMQQRFKVAGSRAKLIARDQTSKITGNLNQARQTNLGITSYIWQTVKDERVRPSHAEKDGKRFLWAAPPPDTGHPGHDINCRCVQIPVIPGVNDQEKATA